MTRRRRRTEPSPAARRARRQRGVIMIELALFAPILLTFLLGIFDYALAWRDSAVVSQAIRAGGRTAASQGAKGSADYYALQALKSGLGSISLAGIDRVVVYNASTNAVPDPACLSMTAPGGQTGTRACNVYTAASLSLAASSFSTSASGSCPVTAVDRYYCPLSRSVVQSSGTDYVGVYIKLRPSYITKLFGSGIDIADRFIVRLEPT